MNPSRAAIVATAGESIARGSKSFALASRLFAPRVREHAWLLYAWCRRCDDIADGQDHGGEMARTSDPAARLDTIRVRTEAALHEQWVGDAGFDALRIVAAEAQLPHRLVWDLVHGFAMDAQEWRPRHEEDLFRYCYHVAGAVGCMMAIVMGVRPDDEALLDRACDLGLAFQLGNIARDVAEDDRAGRCYLPVDWLVEMDIPPGEHMKPQYRKRLAVLAQRLARCAEAYAASGRAGAAGLDFRSAWAVLAAAGIYGGIAERVAAASERAWDRRVHTSAGEKLGWVVRGLGQARNRKTLFSDNLREGLWTRPRHGERGVNRDAQGAAKRPAS